MKTQEHGQREFELYGEKCSSQNMGGVQRNSYRKKPNSIVYVIAQSIPAKNLTALKLILPVEDTQYIFTDCAKGNKLRKTGIPIHTDKTGNHFIEDNDVKVFLKTQLRIEDLQILSYWTI